MLAPPNNPSTMSQKRGSSQQLQMGLKIKETRWSPVRKKLFTGSEEEIGEKGTNSPQQTKGKGSHEPTKDKGKVLAQAQLHETKSALIPATAPLPPVPSEKLKQKEPSRRSLRLHKPPPLFAGLIPTPTKKTRTKASDAKQKIRTGKQEANIVALLREEEVTGKELSEEQIQAIDTVCDTIQSITDTKTAGISPNTKGAGEETGNMIGTKMEWEGLEEGEMFADVDLLQGQLDINDYAEFDMELNDNEDEEELPEEMPDEDLLDDDILDEDAELGGQEGDDLKEKLEERDAKTDEAKEEATASA